MSWCPCEFVAIPNSEFDWPIKGAGVAQVIRYERRHKVKCMNCGGVKDVKVTAETNDKEAPCTP